jgi:hypothetical protein
MGITTCKTWRFLMENKLKSLGTIILAGLMAFFFPLVFHQSPVWAAADCSSNTKDSDIPSGDGFSDSLECGSSVELYLGGVFPSEPSDVRLDPNSRDLFLVIMKATETTPPGSKTYIPEDIIPYITQVMGGLNIKVHAISHTRIVNNINELTNDRRVLKDSPQKAIRIIEDLTSGGDTNNMGTSSCGTPDGDDSATIYTQNIIDMLTGIYGSGIPSDIRDRYIKHVIVHEIGHMIGPLAAVKFSSKLGGYHYAPGSGNVMDQSVQYKGNTWTIGTIFTTADQSGIRLK